MKSLLFVLFLGLATATVTPEKRAIEALISAVENSFEGAGRLSAAVDLPQHAEELIKIEQRMKTKLGEILKDVLDDLVNNLKNRVEKVKNLTWTVKDKVQELRQKLRELGENAETKSHEALELVKKQVHKIVESFRESIKNQETNLDQELDEAAKLKVKDLINKIRERITGKVQAIRQAIKDVTIDNKVVKELKDLLDRLNDSELTEILRNVTDLGGHEMRHLRELYHKLRELAGKSNGILNDKVNDLFGYVQSLWKNGIQTLIEEFKNVRQTLFKAIGDTKDLSVEVVMDALQHIDAYKDQLGDLYNRLVETLKKAIGKF